MSIHLTPYVLVVKRKKQKPPKSVMDKNEKIKRLVMPLF